MPSGYYDNTRPFVSSSTYQSTISKSVYNDRIVILFSHTYYMPSWKNVFMNKTYKIQWISDKVCNIWYIFIFGPLTAHHETPNQQSNRCHFFFNFERFSCSCYIDAHTILCWTLSIIVLEFDFIYKKIIIIGKMKCTFFWLENLFLP